MSQTLMATHTRTGNDTHVRVQGEFVTLCGRESFGDRTHQLGIDYLATCQRCRKSAGLSYWKQQGSRRIRVEATNV